MHALAFALQRGGEHTDRAQAICTTQHSRMSHAYTHVQSPRGTPTRLPRGMHLLHASWPDGRAAHGKSRKKVHEKCCLHKSKVLYPRFECIFHMKFVRRGSRQRNDDFDENFVHECPSANIIDENHSVVTSCGSKIFVDFEFPRNLR